VQNKSRIVVTDLSWATIPKYLYIRDNRAHRLFEHPFHWPVNKVGVNHVRIVNKVRTVNQMRSVNQ
jgi:hypothetical protein